MIVSLCSGYGGLDRAVAAAFRLPIGAHAEPEKISVKAGKASTKLVPNPVVRVLERRFPGVPNLGDIRETDWAPWRGLCTVLCAGFPCQPVSAAGRQLGEDDERWLWPSVHRAILELRPGWIVLENVANIISIRGGEIWRMILEHLREAGYDVTWGIFGACLIGACHHRHRMFLVARRGTGLPAARWDGKACGAHRSGDTLPTPTARDWRSTGPSELNNRNDPMLSALPLLLPTPRARDGAGGPGHGVNKQGADSLATVMSREIGALLPTPTAQSYGSNRGAAAGRVGPVRHSLDALARLELLPTPTAKDSQGGPRALGENGRTAGDRGPQLRDLASAQLLPTPRATDGTNGGPGQRGSSGDLAMPSAVQPENWGRFAVAVARHADRFGAPPAPTEVGPKGGVRMAAPFPEWMMGLAPGYVTDLLPRNDALRAIGNGVMPQQGYHAICELRGMHA